MYLLFLLHLISFQKTPQLPNMEFGRRLASERELEKSPSFSLANARKKKRQFTLIIIILHVYACVEG